MLENFVIIYFFRLLSATLFYEKTLKLNILQFLISALVVTILNIGPLHLSKKLAKEFIVITSLPSLG